MKVGDMSRGKPATEARKSQAVRFRRLIQQTARRAHPSAGSREYRNEEAATRPPIASNRSDLLMVFRRWSRVVPQRNRHTPEAPPTTSNPHREKAQKGVVSTNAVLQKKALLAG
jgi:hypothetical protein